MNFSQFYFLTLKHWQSEPKEADSNEKLEGEGGDGIRMNWTKQVSEASSFQPHVRPDSGRYFNLAQWTAPLFLQLRLPAKHLSKNF